MGAVTQPVSTRQGRVVRQFLGLFIATLLLGCLAWQHADAYSLVEGYYYGDVQQVKAGMFVSRVSTDGNEVEPTTRETLSTAIGVATDEDTGLLTLSNKSSNVYIATSGSLPAFVTDLNGPINEGDRLTVSPLAGVLMKATGEDAYVLGVASHSFVSEGTGVTEVAYNNGTEAVTAKVGSILLYIKPDTNPEKAARNFLVDLGEKIVRKPVAFLQVMFAGIFFVVTILTIMALMGSAVRATITAIGRNPLAKTSVLKGLLQLVGLAIAVLLAGIAGTYLILWI